MKKMYNAIKSGRVFIAFLLAMTFTMLGVQRVAAQISVSVTGNTNTTPNLASSYSDLASAITALNSVTAMSGSVTLTVGSASANQSETAPSAKGFQLGSASLNAVLGSSKTITIVRASASFTVTLNATTGTSSTIGTPDGIFALLGADYVTLDGLVFNDANTASNTAGMEFGVGLFKLSATDGCNNNTIKNCTVTFASQFNTPTGSGPMPDGQTGILIANSAIGTASTAITVSNATGANSNNVITGCTITKGNYGIALMGYAASSPYSLADQNNIVGGGSGLGNNITNFGGGGATNAAAGIRTLAQYGLVISYNTINNNDGGGTNHTTTLRAIYTNTAAGATETVVRNNITIACGATTSQLAAIENVAGSTANSNTITIDSNTIVTKYTTATSGVTYGIYNNGTTPTNLSISNNKITDSTAATSGSLYPIYNSGSVVTSIKLNNDTITAVLTATSTSATVRGFYVTAAASTAALNIKNSYFGNISYTGSTGGTGETDLIYISGTPLNDTITNNDWSNLAQFKTSGTVYLIYNNYTAPANGSKVVQNNKLIAASGSPFGRSVSGSNTFYCYYDNSSSPSTVSHLITGNRFTYISPNTTGSFYGMYSTDYSSSNPTLNFNNDTITNINATTATGTTYCIYLGGFSGSAGNYNQVYNNYVANISVGGSFYGIGFGTSGLYVAGYNNTVTGITIAGSGTCYGYYHAGGTVLKSYNNTVTSITSTGTGTLYGVYLTGPTTDSIYNNYINTFSHAGSVYGIYVSSATTNYIYGHQVVGANDYGIYGLSSSGASSTVAGIQIASGTTTHLYQNTIRGLSSSGSTLPSLAGIIFSSGANALVSQNKIYDLSVSSAPSSSTSPYINGITISAGGGGTAPGFYVYNNLIGDLRVASGSNAEAIRGINITSSATTSTYRIYYNTVYINASSSGTNFGTTGIYHTTSTTATTATLDLRNTIIDNNSTAAGTGTVVAFRRSSGAANTLNNYSSNSNRNIFYAGTPGSSNLIYSDGTSTGQSLSNYTGGAFTAGTISPRDANSQTENTTFASTTGTNSSFLSPSTTSFTYAESGAASIGSTANGYIFPGGVTWKNDFVGTTKRQDSTGYSGNGTAPDIGAYELSNGSTMLLLSNNTNGQTAAANLQSNTTDNIIHKAQLGVYYGTGVLSSASFVLNGTSTYTSSDIANFKLYWTSTNTFATTNLLGTVSSASSGTGETVSFNSLSQSFSTGTYYLWFVADISSGATVGRTIIVNGMSSSSITTSTSGGVISSTSTTSASGTQTIANPCAGTPTAGTASAGSNPVCPSATTTLSLAGTTQATGITYTWHSSTDNFSSDDVTLGSNPTQTTTASATATIYYKCLVTCTNSGQSQYSNTVTLAVHQTALSLATANTGSTIDSQYCGYNNAPIRLIATTAGATATNITWTAITDLYTNNPATTAYTTNANRDTVWATPTAGRTYTATANYSGIGCASRTATKTVTVGTKVTISALTASNNPVCAGNTSSLNGTATTVKTANMYSFSTSTGASLDAMSGATTLLASGIDNTASAVTTFPGSFNFPYEGTNYTQFTISDNGVLRLGSSAVSTTQYGTVNGSTLLISPWGADMGTAGNGGISYVMTGSSPSRIIKVDYKTIHTWSTSGSYNNNYQIWLYENGTIEFRYGSLASTGSFASMGIGICGASTSNYISVNAATNTASTSSVTANSSGPASGRMYTFTPPASPTYAWTPNDGNLSALTGSPVTFTMPSSSPASSYTYYLTANEAGGCSATYMNGATTTLASITLNLSTTAPSLTSSTLTTKKKVGTTYTNISGASSGSAAIVCSTDSIVVRSPGVTGGCTPYTYTWYNLNGDLLYTTSVDSIKYIASTNCAIGATDAYQLTVTDNQSQTISSNLFYYSIVDNSFSVTPSTGLICGYNAAITTDSVALSVSGTNIGTLAWTPSAGLRNTNGTSNAAYPSGTTTYSVTNTFSGCTSAAQTTTITVGIKPNIVSISSSTPSVCTGSTFNLSDSANGGSTTAALLSEGFETFPGSNFSANGVGITAATNTTYYSTGSKSALLTYTASLTTSSTNNSYQLGSNLDLTGSDSVKLTFNHIGALENNLDYGYVQYSTDGGSNWTSFPTTSYQGTGTLSNSVVSFTKSAYSDWNTQFTSSASTPGTGPATSLWKAETIKVPSAALTSSQFRIRFLIASDGSVQYYGWLLDNILVTKYLQGTVSSFAWTSSPSGFTSSTQNPTGVGLQGGPEQTTKYYLTVTNSFGCTRTDSVTVGLGGGTPSVNITRTVGTDSGCYNRNVTLKANVTGGCSPFTYSWFLNGSPISNGGVYTIAGDSLKITGIQVANAGDYSVKVVDNQPDSSTSSNYYVHVYTPGTVTITPSQTVLCGAQSARMVATGGAGGATYVWSPTTELFSNSGATTAYTGTNRDTVWAKISTARTYTVTTQDSHGCSISNTQALTYAANQTLSITASALPSSVCAGSTSSLTATPSASQGNVTNYVVSTSTGASLDAMSGATTLLASGIDNTASAVTTFPGGFAFPYEGTNYTQFTVSDNGVLRLGGTAVGGAIYGTITGNSLMISPWAADMGTAGDGGVNYVVTGSSPSRIVKVQFKTIHTWSTSGTANNTSQVWLYENGVIEFRYGSLASTGSFASMGIGICGASTSNYISINAATHATSSSSVTANTTAPSSGRMYTFTPPNTSLAATKITWTPADPELSGTTGSPITFTMPSSGANPTYTYYATVTDTITTCNATSSAVVVSLASGAPSITGVTASQNNVCYTTGGSTVLTANISGGCAPYNYRWKVYGTSTYLDSAIATSSSTDTFRVQPSATTLYQVVITDNTGATATGTDTVRLTVSNPTPVSATGTSVCGSGIPTVTAVAHSGNGIAWYSAQTGGSFLGYGTSYSPASAISSTTSYWAAETEGTPASQSGLGAPATGVPGTTGATAERGIVFRAYTNFVLESAQYYSPTLSVTNTVTVKLYDSASGTQLATASLPIVQGGTAGWYTMDLTQLNYTCVAGSAYRLTAAFTSSVNRITTTDGLNYAISPYNNLGTLGVIETGYNSGVDATTYSYFHNISAHETACAGYTRLEAQAVVVTKATVTLSNNSQVGTQQIAVNTTNNIISRGTIAVTNNSSTLSAVSVTLNGTYRANEIAASGIKLWYNTANTFTGATQLGSGQTSSRSSSSAESFSFTSLAQALPIGTYYFWITADISSGANTDSTITVNALSSSNITLSGCNNAVAGSVSASGTSTIVNACTGTPNAVTFASSTINACTNTTVSTITGTNNNGTTTAGYTYKWFSCDDNTGTNPVEITGATLISYTPANYTTSGTRYYFNRVYCSFSGDSASSAVVTVNVDTKPVVNLGATSTTICSGSSTTIVDSNYVSGYTYTWSPNVSTTQTATVSPTSTTTYTVSATNNGCVSSNATITITVNPVPVVTSVGTSSATVCAGTTVNLTSTASAGSINLTEGFEGSTFPPTGWKLINAGTGNQWASNATAHTGSKSMAYTFNSTNAANAWAFVPSQYLLSGQTYTVSFWYKVISATFPEKLKVTVGTDSTVAAQTTILWANGTNGSSNTGGTLVNTTWAQASFTYVPSSNGNYNFAFNCYSAADEDVLYVDDVSITGGATITGYAWTSNPAGFTSSSQNPTSVTVSTTTRYIVTATNSLGCTAADSVLVTANPLPAAPTATSDGSSTCGTPTFTVSSNSGAGSPVFAWYTVATGGTAIAGQTGSSYTPGSYTVGNDTVWTAEVSAGCYSTRTQNIITVSAADPHSAAANAVTTCVGTAAMLTVNATTQGNFGTYTWSPVTNLFTDAACTNAYTALDNQDTVYAKPTAAGYITYTVLATNQISGNPSCSASDTVRVTGQAAISITSHPAASNNCGSVNKTLTVAGSSTGTISYQWQSSTDSTSWSNVLNGTPSGTTYSGGTTASLSITALNAVYYYRAVLSDGVCSNANSNAALITAGTPSISSYAGASTCSPTATSLTLGATPSTGAGVRWYATNVSTTILKDSAYYVTPSLSSTTTYYAEPYVQAAAETGLGKSADLTPAFDVVGIATAQRGLLLRMTKNARLISAQYYSSSSLSVTQTVTLTLQDSASGTTLASGSNTIVHGASAAWYTMDLTVLNYTLQAGTTYRLLASFSSTVERYSTGTTINYNSSTWNNLGTFGRITSGYDGGTSATSYNYFHNISLQEAACTGTRQAVTATITTAPSITVGSNTAVCNGSSAGLSVSSSNAGYKFTWASTDGSVTLNGSSQTVSPSATTVYAVTATDTTTSLTYSGCTNTGTQSIIVAQLPSAVSVSASPTQLCGGGVTTLSATGGTTTGQSVLPEPFEVSSPLFATASASGVTAALNGTYYSQGTKSLRISYTNNLSSGASDSLSQNIDLTKLSTATITFKQICATEAASDYGYVQYSTNGGSTWTSFPSSSYSGSGTLKNGVVSFDASSYSDWNSQFTSSASTPGTGPATSLWKTETITVPAAAMTSTQFRIRFRITSGASNIYYGWLVDDIQISGTTTRTYAWTSNPSGFTSSLASPTPSPTVSTDYSLTITNSYGCATASTTPASVTYMAASVQGTATASVSTICNGASTQDTLRQTGGSLGAGAYWAWYTNASFGGAFLVDTTSAADAQFIVSPTSTTTYYLRAEGASLCATTGGSSVTVTVNNPSVAPSSANASATTICAATNITLTQSGGTLGTGASWKWYSDAGFTTLVGTSSALNGSVTVNNVNATTTFYVRAEGTSAPCTTTPTAAASVTVTKQSNITATLSGTTLICSGSSTNLSVALTGTGPWTVVYTDGSSNYTVSNIASSPAIISVSPTITTNYSLVSASASGSCSASVSGTAGVSVVPAAPSGYTSNWMGGTSTDWSVGSNWCSGSAPTGSDNVFIGSNAAIANQPSLSASTAINKLQVQLGGTVTVGSGLNLSAAGDVFKYGNITGSGTLVLNGTSQQQLSGVGTITDNLTVNNSAGVAMGNAATVNTALTLTAGSLDANGNSLTIAGTVSGSGTIAATTSGSVVVLSGPSTIPSQLGSSVAGLTINRSGGVAMAGDFTVSQALVQTSGKLSIGNNTLTLGGTISNSANNSLTGSNVSKITVTTGSGTAYFDQTTSADVEVTDGTNALLNLEKTGSGTFTIGNRVNLFNKLGSTGGTLNLNSNLVLRSTATNTAYVGQVGGTITGMAIVERYIHKQARGWRAVTAPVTYNGLSVDSTVNSVKANWQNSWGHDSLYGTRISGPVANSANGLDDATTGSSLQTFNSTTGAWNKINNTWTELMAGSTATAANKGFYIFIRGDRRILPAGSTPYNFNGTTLAAKGQLQTGTQVFNFTGASGKSWLLGNPYASPISMDSVAMTNIGQYVNIWDPNLTGYTQNTTGNYAAFDRTDWDLGPTIGTNNKYFQSGQSFFVTPSSATASITFHENHKVSSAWNGTGITGTLNGRSDIFIVKLLTVQADGSKKETDGIRAKYGASYNAAVDAQDATKFPITGMESMGILRNGKTLAIESRPNIVGLDSLFLNMASMNSGANYEFKVNPLNFDASVSSCVLVDQFLNTATPISLTSMTVVPFSVTSVAGSNAANRFFFVFNGTGTVPTSNSLSVKAYKQNSSIVVDWEAIAENNMKFYSVEKSLDGNSFSKLADENAKNGNTTNKYSFTDNNPVVGVNYYRIKGTLANSNIKYSAIVRVEMNDKGIKSITVYPNPVKGNTIGLQMNNLEAGIYTARLYNAAGQEIWTNSIKHNGNNGSISVQLKNALSAGSYQLMLADTKGNSYLQTILVVE